MRDRDGEPASFEVLTGERSRILGALEFATVTALLPLGSDAISRGQAAVIDLSGVTHSDSSGLALLIEWLSVAASVERPLRFENIPLQLRQLARLSEVDTLIGTG